MSEKGGQEQPGQQRRSLAAAPLLLWKGCPWPPAGQEHGAAPGGRGQAAVGTACSTASGGQRKGQPEMSCLLQNQGGHWLGWKWGR